MAIHAEKLAVTGDACRGVGHGLLVVHRDEVGSMHRVPHGGVEIQPRRDHRDSNAVTLGALALRVTGGAQIALCVRLHAVLAEEVTVMNHVAFRPRHLSGQIDVASTTVARVPLAFVRVATEARRVLRADVVGVGGHVHMAAYAVPGAFFVVLRM